MTLQTIKKLDELEKALNETSSLMREYIYEETKEINAEISILVDDFRRLREMTLLRMEESNMRPEDDDKDPKKEKTKI